MSCTSSEKEDEVGRPEAPDCGARSGAAFSRGSASTETSAEVAVAEARAEKLCAAGAPEAAPRGEAFAARGDAAPFAEAALVG